MNPIAELFAQLMAALQGPQALGNQATKQDKLPIQNPTGFGGDQFVLYDDPTKYPQGYPAKLGTSLEAQRRGLPMPAMGVR